MIDEVFDIVDEKGKIIGSAPRHVIHSNKSLLHRVIHLLLFNSAGQLLLQKRSRSKSIAPGKWDTSVGGHVNQGEGIRAALKREMKEELSISGCNPDYLYTYIHENERETELVYSFVCTYDGQITFNKAEISEVRFWDMNTISEQMYSDIFSNNFRDEYMRYAAHWASSAK